MGNQKKLILQQNIDVKTINAKLEKDLKLFEESPCLESFNSLVNISKALMKFF